RQDLRRLQKELRLPTGALLRLARRALLDQQRCRALGLLALRDVADRCDADATPVANELASLDLDREDTAAAMHDLNLVRLLIVRPHVVIDQVTILRRDVIDDGRADELLRSVAGEPRDARIHVDDARAVVHHDPLDRGLDQLTVTLLAAPVR